MLYGANVILEALISKRRRLIKLHVKDFPTTEIPKDLFTRIVNLAENLSIPIEKCTKTQLDRFANNRPHQGLVMQCSHLQLTRVQSLGILNDKNYEINITPRENIEMYTLRKYPLFVALDNLVDPQNVGAIIRTCHFFNVDGIVTTETVSCPLNATVSKASSGALETGLEIFTVTNLSKFLKLSGENGWHIYGTSIQSKNQRDITKRLLDHPTVLVLGNEGMGMRQNVMNMCHEHLVIPKNGVESRIDSLNVSVATGILLNSILNNL
jgi:21S rRNA (GM2251-2'-O)-methyltransferase